MTSDPLYRYSGVGHVEQPQEVSFLRLLAVLLRRRRLVLAMVSLGLLTGLAISVVSRELEYRSESRFLPRDAGSDSPQLSGLAAQLAGPAAQTGGPSSLHFYAELLRSRSLLEDVVRSEYTAPAPEPGQPAITGTLDQFYELKANSPETRVRAAMQELENDISVTPDVLTGLITLQVTAPLPELATQVNARIIALVVEFNRDKRRSQTVAEREFVEARMQEAEQELLQAESALKRFFEQNPRYEGSPQLLLEHSQLQRAVTLRQELYTQLARSYDQARIEEVRSLPVITVLEAPEAYTHVAGGGLILNLAFGFVLGLVLAVVVVFGREYIEKQRQRNPEEFSELARLWRSAFGFSASRPRARTYVRSQHEAVTPAAQAEG